MRITELFTAQSIALDEAQQDRSQIIDRLVELQATHGNIRDKEAYKKGLYEREDEGSTYVDNGITVPHAKCDCVTRPSLAALRLKTPVQYNAEDDGKTDLLFAIAAPKNGSLHVDMLARMMQMLMNEDFVEKLRTAKTPEDFLAAIDAQEEEQFGDERVVPFSFSTDSESVQIDQESCWLTYTNEETHKIIRENLSRSPLYSGMIEGTGPRYCPSIEDKVVKFADKNRHQVFLEPEGRYTNEMYVGGMSSSLPEDVQIAMYHTVPGLEHAKIVRNAYAIEYDCINPRQLLPSLEFKAIKNLFSGGQFNGSSGYEEAAAQGLIAGINAALRVQGKEELVLDRSESYIGVLIDDLVTKENHEPYRMMTSRAEYRLLLRQDNADLRLLNYGYRVGLISEEQYEALKVKEQRIQEEIERVENTYVGTSSNVNELLAEYGSTLLSGGSSLAELIRRPELNYKMLAEVDPKRPKLPEDVQEQVNINIKYDGYIKRQMKQVEQFKKMEEKKIPENINYDEIQSLRIEAKQKLNLYRPINIGQASRISGVSPADISVLLVYLGHK